MLQSLSQEVPQLELHFDYQQNSTTVLHNTLCKTVYKAVPQFENNLTDSLKLKRQRSKAPTVATSTTSNPDLTFTYQRLTKTDYVASALLATNIPAVIVSTTFLIFVCDAKLWLPTVMILNNV